MKSNGLIHISFSSIAKDDTIPAYTVVINSVYYFLYSNSSTNSLLLP